MLSKKMQSQLEKGSPIRRAFEEGQRLGSLYGKENVFDFSIGNPEIPAPEAIRKWVRQIIGEDPRSIHGYMCDAGYEEVREKIAASLNRRFGTSFSLHNIVMSAGAAGAINVIMYALLDPGDEVILMRPYYPGYQSFILNWDAELVAVDPDPEDFQPDMEDFRRKITERTKLVIVNSPNNPTGVIYTEETIRGLTEILREKQEQYGHGIYLLSDEPYRELCYIDTYPEGELPFWTEYYENTIIVYSFSKTLSIPGERIGYFVIPDGAAGSRDLIKASRIATGMLGFVNAPSLFQKVAGACVEIKADIYDYRRNRDLLYNTLCRLGFTCIPPQGAFYIFVKTPGGDEKEFLKAAHACRILLVGGSAFGYPGYARISFCVSYDKIKRSLPAFEKLAGMMDLQGGRKSERSQ